jgi:hypothetical protein
LKKSTQGHQKEQMGWQMAEVELRRARESFRIPAVVLRQTCTAFQANPLLPHYCVTSDVSSDLLREFLSTLKGESIEVTPGNFGGISALCAEFGFELSSTSYRLCKLEALVESQGRDIGRLAGELWDFGQRKLENCGRKFPSLSV